MVVSRRVRNKSALAMCGQTRQFGWLECALAASVLLLVLQLLPIDWSGLRSLVASLLGYLDVRTWTWRSCAVVSVLAIVSLVALRAWLEDEA